MLASLSRAATPSHPRLASSYINRYRDYNSLIEDAKCRARNTILIQHDSNPHYVDLCNRLQDTRQIFHIEKGESEGMSLIEFMNQKAMRDATRKALHRYGNFPLPTRMFQLSSLHDSMHDSMKGRKTSIKNRNSRTTSSATRKQYSETINVGQIKYSMEHELSTFKDLLRNHTMSEYALRLRFFTLSQLEEMLCQGLFREFELLPFGSSVLNIGTNSSDLDILMTRKNYIKCIKDWDVDLADGKGRPVGRTLDPDSGLSLVHCNKDLTHTDEQTQKVIGINLLANTMKTFMPSIKEGSVLALPKARVPIIKFTFDTTDIDCDLSLNLGLTRRKLSDGYSGPLMTQLLFALCKSTNIFAPVATCIRLFAQLRGITGPNNQGFTNFQLLTLIIFYLQQVPIPYQVRPKPKRQEFVVPPFSDRPDVSEPLGHSHTLNPDNHVNVDEEVLHTILPNLIVNFFDYYDRFDFNLSSISLLSGKTFKRYSDSHYNERSPVFVENPYDKSHNICRTVSFAALRKFQKEIGMSLKDINKHGTSSRSMMAILTNQNIRPDSEQNGEQLLRISNIGKTLFTEELDKPIVR